MVARGAGDFLEPEGYIGLCSEIELHVGVDRKRVEALLTEPSPVTIRPHKPFINGETRLFADGAGDRVQTSFDFLLSQRNHDEGCPFHM